MHSVGVVSRMNFNLRGETRHRARKKSDFKTLDKHESGGLTGNGKSKEHSKNTSKRDGIKKGKQSFRNSTASSNSTSTKTLGLESRIKTAMGDEVKAARPKQSSKKSSLSAHHNNRRSLQQRSRKKDSLKSTNTKRCSLPISPKNKSRLGNERNLVTSITKRKWEVVESILPEIYDFSAITVYCSNCDALHNLLLFSLQFNPPYHIVKQIVRSIPLSVFETNCMNRYPLHTALLFGTSPKVVNFLLKKNPDAAKETDQFGKSVFHLAIDGYDLMKLDSGHGSLVSITMVEIIDLLFHEAPEMILVKDVESIKVTENAQRKHVEKEIRSHLKTRFRDALVLRAQENSRSKRNFSFNAFRSERNLEKMMRNSLRSLSSRSLLKSSTSNPVGSYISYDKHESSKTDKGSNVSSSTQMSWNS